MADLQVFSLGDKGVNRVKAPHALENDELLIAQNAGVELRGARHGLAKRPGLGRFTSDLVGTVLAVIVGGLTNPPSPSTPVDPGDPDAPDPDADLKKLLLDLVYMRCRLFLTAATTSIADNTATVVSWTAEDFDVGALHDLSTDLERVTIPSGGDGLYLIIGQAKWATSASAKKRGLRIYKNDTGLHYAHDSAADDDGDGMTQQVVGILPLVATDYITLQVEQDTTGALDLLGGTVDETSLVVIRIVQTRTTPLPRCHAYKTGNQTLTLNTPAIVTFDAEALDNAAMHDNAVNNSRITCPQAGHYLCIGHYSMAMEMVGHVLVEILKNGVQVLAKAKHTFINAEEEPDTTDQVVGSFDMVAGDFFELRATFLGGPGASKELLGGNIFKTGMIVSRVA